MISRASRITALLLAAAACWPAFAKDQLAPSLPLDAALSAVAPQRPGTPDLYVLGFAGDSQEAVFRNEVVYLQQLFGQRFGAEGRVLALGNQQPPADGQLLAPATLATLRQSLAHLGRVMDPDEDILLLYLTTHGNPEHELLVRRGNDIDVITPRQLRAALDDAGIRHRVLVLSACFSGGFVRALRDDNALVLTAAKSDRQSFGCSSDHAATYFGRAWLVDGLNQQADFVDAFRSAQRSIELRELRHGLPPSMPQINLGRKIGARLQAWQAGLAMGPAVPYPFAEGERAAKDDANLKHSARSQSPDQSSRR